VGRWSAAAPEGEARVRRRLLLVAVLGMAWASAAGATSQYMQRLPTSQQFRCLNCHATQDPTAANATLNVFGTAFRANGLQWNRTLASLRSDGDACSNGFELGDEDGNGQPDAGVTSERSNPGQSDCTLQLNEKAWTALKQLFR
jgi:hypothetical protein